MEQINEELFGRAFVGGFQRTVTTLKSVGVASYEAEEIAQAAWVRGWERRRQLKDADRIVAWVLTIAVNIFRDGISERRRFTDLRTAGGATEKAPAANPDLIHIERCLDRCPAGQRRLLEAVIEGHTAKELALSLSVSVEAIHHRVSRARRALRRAIDAA